MVKWGNRGRSFSGRGAGPTVFPLASGMSDPPHQPDQHAFGGESLQLQLILQLLDSLLGSFVLAKPAHRVLQVRRAVSDYRQMLSVFGDKMTTPIFVQVNDGGLSTRGDLCRVRGHLGDCLLLPGEYGITYLLQLIGPLSHGVDVVFDPVQVVGMALPALLGAPGEGPQGVCMAA